MAALLHLKSSFLGLFYDTPGSRYHHRTLLHPLNEEHYSAFNHGSTAISRLFGAIGEHPAVAAVGWDVILSGFSLGWWACIRGLDARRIVESSLVLLKPVEKEFGDAASSVIVKTEQAVEK
jgi:hypothetical protein